MKRTSKDYVCPFCFYPVEKCKCELYPQGLILIDEPMQYAIQKLNEHGYKTIDCCAGHEEDKIKNTYLSFYVKPECQYIPNGFTWEKHHGFVLRYIYHCKNTEQFLEEQKIVIDNLNRWVDDLCADRNVQ